MYGSWDVYTNCKVRHFLIEACIESCIGALDELIIVFHDCTDNTPQILRTKQAQYSSKIKIYEYRLYILPIEMNQPIFSFAEPIFSYFYTIVRKYIPWNKLKDLEKQYNVSIKNEHTRRMNK